METIAHTPALEYTRSRRAEVATAQKCAPMATLCASSPGGRGTDQSLPGAQASKGKYCSMLGASRLEVLARVYPYAHATCVLYSVLETTALHMECTSMHACSY